MSIIRNIVFLSFFFFIISHFAKASQKDWTLLGSVKTKNMQLTMKDLSLLDLDIAGVDIDSGIIDILMSEREFQGLSEKGYEINISETKGVSAAVDEQYKNPDEIEVLLRDFNARYPTITKLESIGKSLEGRDIWVLKISDNPDLDENEPSILFNSMHHAREVMTPEVSLDIIEYLLTNYNLDSQVKGWVNNNEIFVIPMLNVDGNNKMWNGNKWWRKNTRGGYGVDLNRNYPAGWKSCNGSSGSRFSQTYRGPKPGSEPETQNMMNFVQRIRPVFNISYHSYSEIVIYPYGCSPKRTLNADIVEGIGNEIASLLNSKAGTSYELLYNTDGGDIDWMYDEFQVIPYVVEVNSRKEGFQPDYVKWRKKTVERNRAGWQLLLDKLSASGVRGIYSVHDMSPRKLEIEVFNNSLKEMTYKVQDSGLYHLVLSPGTYTLVYKAQGEELKRKMIKIESKLKQVNIEL